jgi:HK97 family phage portal protein
LQKRSIFQKMFGGVAASVVQYFTRYKMMNGYSPIFTPFGNNAYASDVVRSTVHSIASNAAKLKPKHIRRMEGNINPQNSNLDRLLTVRPNPHMNAYDFYYKVVTQLYMKNNAFILIQSDGFNVVGFYPIIASNVELLEYQDELFAKFTFSSARTITVSYNDVIHLRRFYYDNDMFGESNSEALLPTLELIHTSNEGISNAVKSSANLRGLLKFTQAMMKPEDIKKQRDEFVADYMDVNNNGGIAALDAKADYTPLNNDPKMVNGPQMKLIEEKVYKYFNVNESIVMSKYNENEWNAFYESVIEPLAVQMSLEFTSKLFSDRQQGFGNEIIFEANRLQYASTTTKINVIKTLMPMGLLSINEGREVLNLAPVEDGDKRLVSLNFVSADKADKYQLGEGDGNGKTTEGDPPKGTPTNGDSSGSGS